MARDHMGTGLPANLVWSYERPRARLAQLYEEAKDAQWDAAADLDWSVAVDPGALMGSGHDDVAEAADLDTGIDWAGFGDPLTTELGTAPDVVHEIVAHQHAWMVSQLLHGEQGALVAMAKVCAVADTIEAKCCAALQLADEARHVEAYRRYLDKIGISYDVSPAVQELLTEAIGHRSLDLTYVGTQVLVEGTSLAAASLGGSLFGNPLICQIVERIRQDEARHLEFGASALDGLYAGMDPVERREREDFVLEACSVLRHRFQPRQVWEHFGIDTAAAAASFADSPDVATFHALVFCRVVPDLQRLGLVTPRVRHGFEAMGVLQFGTDGPAEVGDGAGSTGSSDGGRADGGRAGGGAGGEAGLNGSAVDVWPAGLVGAEPTDPLLALRAALGCVEQIAPEPVLTAMAGLADRRRLAGVPRAAIRLVVTGTGGGEWLVTVGDGQVGHRRAGPGDRAEVTVRMGVATWTEIVAGRVTMPAALASGRITVTGDIFKARALEALL